MDTAIGPVSAQQQVSERVIGPYLRDPVSIGISSSRRVVVTPNKPLEKTDTRYDFVLPSDTRNVLNLAGILLHVQGRVRVKNAVTELYEDIGPLEECSLASNTLYSLFSSVTVTIGVNQVCICSLYEAYN